MERRCQNGERTCRLLHNGYAWRGGLCGYRHEATALHPGVKGTNGVEVTLLGHREEGVEPVTTGSDRHAGGAVEIRLTTGMAVQIGSFYG